jgi:hypothetical protein
MTSVDLFIRSYYKDLGWLVYCLKSIEKYAQGFRDVILVVPASSAQRLSWSGLGRSITTHVCDDFSDDYLGQQVTKMQADHYSDADFICHVDSDCIFRRPITPSDLISSDKAVISMVAYAALRHDKGWQQLSERFMRRPVEFDFMRRQPLVYPRWIYSSLRDYTMRIHRTSLQKYIVSQPRRGFSEYNAMGAYAYYHHFRDFCWLKSDCVERDESICRWFWSWNGISAEIKDEIDSILMA